jgi:alpha,alpha-trehalose phosphorylase
MFLLGKDFSLEEKKRNFVFYDPLTTGDSSLSSCIQSIMAHEIGAFDQAVEYTRAALLMDLADVGGNVKDGCHIASMGGTWMIMAYGFAGMQDNDGVLTFRPKKPPGVEGKQRFPLNFRGQLLQVENSSQGATYSLLEGDGLTIRHDDEEISLTQDNPIATRPIAITS